MVTKTAFPELVLVLHSVFSVSIPHTLSLVELFVLPWKKIIQKPPNKHIRSEALETPQCHFLTSITLSSKHQWKIPSGRMRTWAEALPRSHPEDVILCH